MQYPTISAAEVNAAHEDLKLNVSLLASARAAFAMAEHYLELARATVLVENRASWSPAHIDKPTADDKQEWREAFATHATKSYSDEAVKARNQMILAESALEVSRAELRRIEMLIMLAATIRQDEDEVNEAMAADLKDFEDDDEFEDEDDDELKDDLGEDPF